MKWIGFITDKKYDLTNKNQDYGMPSSYIVRKIKIDEIKKTTIRVASLGVYSLYVNGKLVNNSFMGELSEYDKIVYYNDYDISKYLVKGINSIAFILSDGWYTSNLSNQRKCVFGDYPNKISYLIFIEKELKFISDGSEVAHDGAIRACDNQNGIIIDNNFDLGDFSSPNYDVSNWEKVSTFDLNNIKLVKSFVKPVTLEKTFNAKLIKSYQNHHIFDFGQNFAGVVHMIVSGKKNTKITIKHAEFLDEKEDVYTANLRSALAKDTFILKGDKEEEFLPRHTFHGFRYVDVIIDGEASIKLIEGYAIWNKMRRMGYIKTNNRLVNRIYSNALWGQRSNFLSVPTDCPQRDERMGWTGDAQIFSPTAMFNYDTKAFYKKYVNDLCTSMDLYDGKLACFVPFFFKKSVPEFNNDPNNWAHSAPGWSDAIIIIPFNLYLFYGDKTTLRKAYPYMKKFHKYIFKYRMENNHYKGFSFGDWLSVFEVTDVNLYNDAYIAYDCYLLMKISQILNNKDEEHYRKCFEEIRVAFRNKYLLNDGRLLSDTQGAYVLAYSFHLISKEEAQNNLIRKINEYKHLTTGFHSTKFLLGDLCEFSKPSLAYHLLNNKKYPSWGYMISCGATTIWERWDSYRKDKGFNDEGMNSFNHYSLGSVVEWMYKDMVGISPTLDSPAFKKTIISPYFDKSVSHLKSTYKTPNGKIEIEYQLNDGELVYHLKGDPRIEFEFKFNNEVISKEMLDKNNYKFTLKY